jgi:threonine aldolase
MLAAAGKMALTAGFERMHLDHENASYLAAQLEGMPGVTVKEGWTQTNMVWLEFEESCGEVLSAEARAANVLVSAYGQSCRIVTHHDVDKADIDRLVLLLKTFFQKAS